MTHSMKWNQCRIEAVDNIKNKVRVEGSVRKALKVVSEESGIPIGTLTNWLYPERQKRYESNRPRRTAVRIPNDIFEDLTETEISEIKQDAEKQIKSQVTKIKKEKLNLYHEKENKLKDTSNVVIDNISNRYNLYNCDLLDAPIEDNSLDAIVTDPPYSHKFIDCWSSLATFARAKLKEGGILVAISGRYYLPEVYKNMTIEELNYYWTCCIQMTVSANLYHKRLKSYWKPLLFYVKGEYNRTFLKSDVFKPDYSDTVEGQKHHKWGQSLPLMKDIIERFTYADELICDPFAGGNTTILAGLELKRRMIGIEIDKGVHNNAKKRLEDYFNVEQSV